MARVLPPLAFTAAVLLMPGEPAPAASSPPTVRLRDFVGVNAVVNNEPAELAQVAKWVRDYHKWYWYEDEKDAYNWSTGSPKLRRPAMLDAFYGALKGAGVSVMPVVEFAPGWASSNGTIHGIPHADEHAEYLGELARHFGDTLAAVENFNEPNQWWQAVPFPAAQLGAMTARDYAAVKAANPDLPFVLAGLAGPDTEYLDEAARASDGRFDVINFHWYAEGDARRGGKNPEAANLRKDLDRVKAWRSTRAPGKAIWITEFGWDTFEPSRGAKTKVFAPEAAAANYLLRTIFLMQAQHVEKGFVFTYRDPGGEEARIETLYNSAGLVENDGERDGRKKAGWYYLATLQNVLGEYAFERVVADGPRQYHYEYVVPGTDARAAVLWARDGERDRGFESAYKGPAGKLVVPVDGSTAGHVSETDGALVLSETPVFVLYSSQASAAALAPGEEAIGADATTTPVRSATRTRTVTPIFQPAGAAVPSSDRLVNGGFEGGLQGWNVPSWYASVVSIDRSLARTGTAALRFKGSAIGPYAYQEIEASPGETVQFSGWVSVAEHAGSDGLVVEMVARHVHNGDLASFPLATLAATTDGWVQVVGSAVMPERTAKLRVQIGASRLNGTAYFDDFSLSVRSAR